MTRMTALPIAGALALAVSAWPALAERIDLSEVPQPQPGDRLLYDLRAGSTIERVLDARLGALRRGDANGDGLTPEDIALQEKVARAEQRADAVGRILAYDLDGDFEVTRAEAEQSVGAKGLSSSRGGSTLDRTFERQDQNSDGTITLAEAAAEATSPGEGRRTQELQQLAAFDADHDGRVTGVELRPQIEAAFNAVDVDRDGVISESEFAPVQARIRAAFSDVQRPACAMPELPRDALLISFGVYDGQALSSAAVGGQDNETNVTDIAIEAGATPIYLTLTSHESMVWRLTGATSRVVRVVASSYHTDPSGRSAVGLIGVPHDRVTITTGECLQQFHRQAEGESIAASLRRSVGRVPDAMFGVYSAKGIALPSGEIAQYDRAGPPPPDGFEQAMWRDAIRYWPGGVVEVDPRALVTPAGVERYSVLPSQMGLAQLLGAGAIQREPNSRALRVVKPIPHMPPGMGGAHSEELIFSAGVPVPPGDPVHTCIVREGAGPLASGPRCGGPPPVQIIAR